MLTTDQLYRFMVAAALTLMLTACTYAQAPGEKRQGGIDALMERALSHDENEDGKLTKEEMPERLQRMFARADKDEDGQLTKDEIRRDLEGREGGGGRGREGGGRGRAGTGPGEGRPPFGGPDGPGGMPMFPLMTALDANNDGEISADEINNATAALKKLDRNKDGRLDHEELRPAFGGGPGGDRDHEGDRPGEGRSGEGPGGFVDGMLQRHDSDKDGKLSGDEIPERMRQNLAHVDTNKDKAVDRSELEAMAKRFSEGRGQGGGRGGEGGGQRRRPPVEE